MTVNEINVEAVNKRTREAGDRPLVFRVKYGYGLLDYVQVRAGGELEKAMYAMLEHITVSIGGKAIQGKNIIVIEPDSYHYTGWNIDYKPSEVADYKQLERDCPNFVGVFEYHINRVRRLINQNRVDQIGKAVELTEDKYIQLSTSIIQQRLTKESPENKI